MISLLIIAHEALAAAYRDLTHHFFNEIPPSLQIMEIGRDEEPELLAARIVQLAAEFPENHGTLIMADVFGATPCNVVRRVLPQLGNALLLTGINVSMLVKAVQYADKREDLRGFADEVRATGVEGIMLLEAESSGG